jgi:hypothetical protein
MLRSNVAAEMFSHLEVKSVRAAPPSVPAEPPTYRVTLEDGADGLIAVYSPSTFQAQAARSGIESTIGRASRKAGVLGGKDDRLRSKPRRPSAELLDFAAGAGS